MNSKYGGINIHQTIGMVRAAVKIPAGAPASRLAARIAGKKVAKYSVVPNDARMTCVVVAISKVPSASAKAGNDQGFSLNR